MYKTEYIINHHKTFTEHTMKNKLDTYCSNITLELMFMNTENSKTSESHKFVPNLSQSLDLRNSNKHIALQNLSIYYTWKNIRQQYKNN